MSSLSIRERFTLDAPPDLVWGYLIQPERIVDCLPGASLESSESDVFHGRVKVKVGAVTVAYKGTMEFVQLDHEHRRMRLEGKGRETVGAGSAKMTMEGTVTPAGGAGCEVTIEADIQIAGKIVRFGRGMIEAVSKELFAQFTECLAGKVTQPETSNLPGSDDHPPGSADPLVDPAAQSTTEGDAVDALGLFVRVIWKKISWAVQRLFGRG